MKKLTTKQTMTQIMGDPKYQGKYVVIVDREVYSTRSGQKHTEILEKLIEKYPKKTPLVTYVPKEGTLILVSL